MRKFVAPHLPAILGITLLYAWMGFGVLLTPQKPYLGVYDGRPTYGVPGETVIQHHEGGLSYRTTTLRDGVLRSHIHVIGFGGMPLAFPAATGSETKGLMALAD